MNDIVPMITKPYLCPKIAFVLQFFQNNRIKNNNYSICARVIETSYIRTVYLIEDEILHRYTEDNSKYFGLYSVNEIFDQLVAGMCGPESPLWLKVPRQHLVSVVYDTNHGFHSITFCRNLDIDGDWLVYDINNTINEINAD